MIIHTENVKKRYKKEWVLKGIDIKVETPQIIALVGPNGSGKTTLLNCMTNLLPLDDGTVELMGKKHTNPNLFKEVSYLQDNRILYDTLTGYDHLKFICGIQKIPYTKISKVAERIGMSGYLKKRVRNYSLGMKQHLLLAMAIINKPKLLLLDEPLTGLDPTSVITMRNILLELYKEGVTIFLSSHNLDEIDRLTNSIYFVKDGQLLKESLLDLEVRQYIVEVHDVNQAKSILKDEGTPFSDMGENKVSFLDTDIELELFINKMYENEVGIRNIDQAKIGAEQRYQELFKEVI